MGNLNIQQNKLNIIPKETFNDALYYIAPGFDFEPLYRFSNICNHFFYANLYYTKQHVINHINRDLKNSEFFIVIDTYIQNKITNVLLITNETNEQELSKLSNILKEFNINTIVFDSVIDNSYLKYLINDICSIIIGSKCRYQLHGYGSFNRMSQYGRWIIEENINCIKYFLE